MLTPLEIEILLHYNCGASDFRGGDFSAPAVREAINKFRNDCELIENWTNDACNTAAYRLTKRGQVFVDALCAVPLPVQVWVTPVSTSKARED